MSPDRQLILGLDLATGKTGVVLLDLSTREIYQRDTITARSTWATSRRAAFIAAALVEWIVDPLIVDIWAEDLGTRQVQTAFALGRIHQTAAQAVADHSPLGRTLDNAFGLLSPNTVKLHAGCKVSSKKPEMIAAALKRWPALVDATDDEADAAWIADLGAVKFAAAVEAHQPTQQGEPT